MAGKTGLRIIPSVFVSGSSGLLKQVKGWRLFMIADASGVVCPNSAAAEPMSAKREPDVHGSPGHEPGNRDLRKKTGRSIRCPARIRPLHKEPEPVSSPMDKRTGASPSCLRVSHNPCLLMLPFRFAHARRMRPLSVGRMTTPFIQRRIIMPVILNAL